MFLINEKNNKKAAMFGLDARIALAIFGSLSVITGAVLYNTIKNVRVTALNVELGELTKAIETYYLDTSQVIDAVTTYNVIDLDTTQLVKSTSVNGWQGPYFVGDSVGGRYITSTNNDVSSYHAMRMKYKDWGATPNFGSSTTLKCAVGDCNVWVCARLVEDNRTSLAKQLDILVDGEEGSAKGKLRLVTYTSYIYACKDTGITYPQIG